MQIKYKFLKKTYNSDIKYLCCKKIKNLIIEKGVKLMKKIAKILLTSILLMSILSAVIINVHGVESVNEKIYCTATIDDNFADDIIIVVLSKDATFSFYEYTSNDFDELGEIIVDELTEKTTEIVKEKYLYNIDYKDHAVKISDDYRRIIKITLLNKGKDKVLDAIKKLEERQDILSAEPSYYGGKSEWEPSEIDSYIFEENNTTSKDWWIKRIGLDKVWDLDLPQNTITVGIIDSGIDFSHPDLINRKSNIEGKSYINNVSENTDDYGHGTNIASIIGGIANNGGMVGMTQYVEFVSYKILDNIGFQQNTYSSDLVDAVIDATGKGIKVLSHSSGKLDSSFAALSAALSNYEGLFICSAGNDGFDNNHSDRINSRFPSNVPSNNLIAVGASSILDTRLGSSNYGKTTVDLFAPGELIYSAVPIKTCKDATQSSLYNGLTCEYPDGGNIHHEDGYHYTSNTSVATPMVTGAVVILLSILEFDVAVELEGTSLYLEVKKILLDTVDITNVSGNQPFVDQCVSGGRLNVFNAVKYVLTNYGINTMYSLNNNTNLVNINKYIYGNSASFTNTNGLYKLSVTNFNSFVFKASANNAIDIILYDEDFNEIEYNDLDSSSIKVEFLKYLSTGTYYLRTKFINSSSSGNISIQIKYTPNLSQGNNNILAGYTNGIEDYVYTNNNSAGFYKITLNATNSSGTIEYPERCIKVYADVTKQQMLSRLETIFYTLNAETQGDSNNLIVFLEYEESYYINIDLPSDTYSSMNINIERLSNTYDIIESNTSEEHVILDENTTAYGDFIQRIEIFEAGTYTISFVHNGPQSEENLMGQVDPLYLYYAFYKEVYSPAEQFGDLEMIFPHIASSMGGTISFTFNLQPGVYYIGYYNKLNNAPMSISITS